MYSCRPTRVSSLHTYIFLFRKACVDTEFLRWNVTFEHILQIDIVHLNAQRGEIFLYTFELDARNILP